MRKILTALLVAGLLAVNSGPFMRLVRLRRETARLEMRIEVMVRENKLLREEIERLEKDPLEVEKAARLELGLIREGEWIIRER